MMLGIINLHANVGDKLILKGLTLALGAGQSTAFCHNLVVEGSM